MNNKTYYLLRLQLKQSNLYLKINNSKTLTSKTTERKIAECYQTLNIPIDSKQDAVRTAFLALAKKYHPDSGSPEADINKFVNIENAFRTLTKYNTGKSNSEEIDQIVYDIRHTAPQHRQYLSYEGYGYGTSFQRQKQYAQARAQKAATNVMEHRMEKAIASEKTLMKKGQSFKKHDIKTKYGFDRLVEDLIQESMSKGEFENLSGKGKPLKDQNSNPYVDFVTHKLNEVLINNGFTPEWIMMSKEIDEAINQLKKKLSESRMYFGPYPLDEKEHVQWNNIYKSQKEKVKSINARINTYNLIVPLINKQKFHVDFDKICEDVLKNGVHSVKKELNEQKVAVVKGSGNVQSQTEDFVSILIKALGEFLSFSKQKKS